MGPRKRGRLCTVCPTKGLCVHHIRGFPGGSVVTNPPANACQRRRCGVRSLGQEDPLEKEMATRSSTLVWEIPWTEEPGGLQSTESQRVGHDLGTEQENIMSGPRPSWLGPPKSIKSPEPRIRCGLRPSYFPPYLRWQGLSGSRVGLLSASQPLPPSPG